jgi:hypothetical protein
MFLCFCVPNIYSYQIFCFCIFFLFLFCIPPFQTGTLAAITIKTASFGSTEHACLRVESHAAEEKEIHDIIFCILS